MPMPAPDLAVRKEPRTLGLTLWTVRLKHLTQGIDMMWLAVKTAVIHPE